MPRRQKFAVAVLFGMGIIVTIAGIVRTWYIYRSLVGECAYKLELLKGNYSDLLLWHIDDQTWYAYPLWIAAAIEIDLGVVSGIE